MNDASKPAPPPPEIIYVATKRVSCDGGPLGHPLVWYTLEDGEAECGYCDRKFVYDPSKAASSSRP